ncbi:hypothetical protein SAMN05192559_102361 [Halobacillus karajensis]|uniref:Uncharacterized protein n=1 Tax=Halobacillus karajensis TaxID=195088 RepID=A0A024P7D6_9BACI|nr:hypothetical protein [Halobacillus karajensis]CDQ17846.1 hypothetical protein BN982_00084 [Halobacillus karajensis]CDQ24252.1 hypothetical protein BN983_02524 [Halobacillus karajensis]CDQ29499.1 hypothetical protein BN981_03882 [Halobacillus karajensis]SEH62857.1 hypothetical protein SAMN05192559_102361 [Halobacillus karajensis]
MIFKILLLLLLLFAVYTLVKKERKWLKWGALAYFIIVSIVFITGSFYIITEYQLYNRPIDGGFNKHMRWVSMFSYLYILPVLLLTSYKVFTWKDWNFRGILIRVLSYGFIGLGLVCGAYLFFAAFILIFYGFAP